MSYGTNAPFGFQPRSYLNGTTWTGQQSEYMINGNLAGGGTSYATNIFTGDLVKLAVDGTIQKCAVGDATIGVFVGCKYFDVTNTLVFKPYWPLSTLTFQATNPTAFVVDDPFVLFSAQVLGTAPVGPGGTASVATINYTGTISDLNFNYNIGLPAAPGGSTFTGQSGAYIDMATQGTGPTLQLKLIRLEPRVGNTFGQTWNNGLVLLNNHIYKGGTGTAGI